MNYLGCRDHSLAWPITDTTRWRQYCMVGGEELILMNPQEAKTLQAEGVERWGSNFLGAPHYYNQETGEALNASNIESR